MFWLLGDDMRVVNHYSRFVNTGSFVRMPLGIIQNVNIEYITNE